MRVEFRRVPETKFRSEIEFLIVIVVECSSHSGMKYLTSYLEKSNFWKMSGFQKCLYFEHIFSHNEVLDYFGRSNTFLKTSKSSLFKNTL